MGASKVFKNVKFQFRILNAEVLSILIENFNHIIIKVSNELFYEMVLKRRFWILESYTVKYFRRWYFYKRLE